MPKYDLTEKQIEDAQKRFTYHKPKEDQPQRYEDMRGAALMLALGILQNTPPSREQSLALTKLEECCFWVNAGIARNE